MRIGIDGATWANGRGYGRFTRELVRALARLDRGHTYTLFVDQQTALDEVPRGVQVVTVAVHQSPSQAAAADGYRSLGDMAAFSRAISSAPIDIAFFPSVYSFVPVLRPLKILVAIHDVIPERFPQHVFPSRRGKLFWNIKTGVAVRQATRILTVSAHAAQGIQEYYHLPAARICQTSEAPAAAFRPIADKDAIAAARQHFGVGADNQLIIYFGGLSPHKNIGMLVDVFADRHRRPDLAHTRLLIAGDYTRDVFYSGYQALRAKVDATCRKAVIFSGYIDDETAALLLNGADACVLPSFDEGFGLPGIEAAACGAPLIATCRSALPEVLGDAAIYIDPARPAELSAALMRVLQDASLRQTMGARGRERAARLTWDAAAERVLQVFAELAS